MYGLVSPGVRLHVVVTLYMYGLVSPGVRLQVVVTLYMYGLVSPGVRLQVVVTLQVISRPNTECMYKSMVHITNTCTCVFVHTVYCNLLYLWTVNVSRICD